MSYTTYITEALVCGGYNRNGSDRTFYLFTKDLGMLYAEAKSVREERSRQRYALQDFSRIRVALVKGKSGWRVGSVEVYTNDFTASAHRGVRISIVKLYRLLRRFIQGQDPHPELFTDCWLLLDKLAKIHPEVKINPAFDLAVELRFLEQLGYVSTASIPPNTPALSAITVAAADSLPSLDLLRKLIMEAHKESQL